MNGSATFRVLSIDGGGIKGVFAAALLADFEDLHGQSVADSFDLIAGTSTGGIIALGLALGIPAAEILDFYERYGPLIFGNPRGWLMRVQRTKYSSKPLRAALEGVFDDRRLGEARTRLVVPSLNPETGDVYVFKTSHHERFEHDYRERVVDVALATAAAPTFFPTHRLPAGTPLIDGGIWANNPMGVAAVEAVGVLGWPKEAVKLLGISCTDEAPTFGQSRRAGVGYRAWSRHLIQAFMGAQSSAAVGTATLLLGKGNVHRISKTVGGRRYRLDSADAIRSLKGLGRAVAREEYPKVKAMFLSERADPFVPVHPSH